jgi:hypothetical protein
VVLLEVMNSTPGTNDRGQVSNVNRSDPSGNPVRPFLDVALLIPPGTNPIRMEVALPPVWSHDPTRTYSERPRTFSLVDRSSFRAARRAFLPFFWACLLRRCRSAWEIRGSSTSSGSKLFR